MAADGVNSRALHSMGMSPPQAVYTLSQRMDASVDACEFWFGSSHAPNFYSWLFPAGDGIFAGTAGYEAATATPGKALLKNFLKRRGLSSEGQPRGYRMPLWQRRPLRKGRVLFAGDCAGHVMPLTFEGIYYAMKSARFAAEALINGRPSEYEKLWQSRFQRRFSFARRLWAYFFKDDASMERFISFLRLPSVQEACMRLWLQKSTEGGSLLSFMNVFRKFIH